MSERARTMSRGAGALLVLMALIGSICLLCGCAASQPSSDQRAASSESDPSADSSGQHERQERSDDYHSDDNRQSAHEQEHRQEGSSDAAIPKSDKTVQVTLNGQPFAIELVDNATAEAFVKTLPLQVEMSELDGNEKYVYLDSSLPSNPTALGTVEAGDVMLFQGDCLVIFYETHQTSYSYTRIGKVSDASALARAVGAGAVSARFESK